MNTAAIHPLVDSGILLASLAAVALNIFFNGTRGDRPALCEQPAKPTPTERRTGPLLSPATAGPPPPCRKARGICFPSQWDMVIQAMDRAAIR